MRHRGRRRACREGPYARALTFRLRRFGFEAAAAGTAWDRLAARRSLITIAAAAAMKIVE